MDELLKIGEEHHESAKKVNERLDRMVKNGMEREMAIEVLKRMYNDITLRTKVLGLRK